jgi:hypothetical protein
MRHPNYVRPSAHNGDLMRNLIATMGDNFRAWADVYFSPESGKLNVEVSREEAFSDYWHQHPKISPLMWRMKLEAWVQLNYYTLNPPELCNCGKRIIRKPNGKSVEVFYIQTKESNVDADSDELSW